MKRSDAVEILKSILREWDGCLIDTKAASQILNRIQKEIGMMPPNIYSHLIPLQKVENRWFKKGKRKKEV